ncbi:MAG: hypothetical protein HY892_10140 [Deltaproteobacteria bacterium]|nr:hypothetical protein [Deltaproteobacteria bacterium]
MQLNGYALFFFILNAVALLALPRRYAPLPLLVGACYITRGQGIDLGGYSFTVVRMLVAVGVVRLLLRGERLEGGIVGLDWLMVSWSLAALASSFFHQDPQGALVYRLGLVYDAGGIYLLVRVFCHSLEDLIDLCSLTAILLVPIALEMLYEKMTNYNVFSILGGIPATLYIREGKIRAQGPFAHSILAGTVGAVCLPLMIGLWKFKRKTGLLGILASLAIVYASASSGPLMSAAAALAALAAWRYRLHMRLFRWLLFLGYVALDLIMKDPAYFILARIDLVGGSTGWHRASLIRSALSHLNEWWLWGTDYTRHWMPTGVSWSPDHTDITNHYLEMGVLGGLPLMFLFIASLVKAFSLVGKTVLKNETLADAERFMAWALGASLFAHTTTMVSVSYFDQSFVFLYLALAAAGSLTPLTLGRESEKAPVVGFPLEALCKPGPAERPLAVVHFPGLPVRKDPPSGDTW